MKNHELEELSKKYLLQKKLAPTTIKSYKIAFKYYILYLKENNILYAKTSDVIQYRESRRRLGYSSHYIYIDISALKGLYRYLRINQKRLGLPEVYAYDIMAPIKNERIKRQIKKPILTIKQAKKLLLHTKECRKYLWHYRDHAIIYLMLVSGLRRIEIIHAKRKDYQIIGGKQILYVPRKGLESEDEFVNLSKGGAEALNDYLNKRIDDIPYLFISHKKLSSSGHLSRTFFRDMFKRVLKACDLDKTGITPHSLRHTAAAMNLLRGASIEQTRSLMRHKNIQSTLVYKDHIDRLKDESEAKIEAFILKEAASLFYYEFIA